MKKKIIAVRSGEVHYRLGEQDQLVEGRLVNHIEFKRDGVYGVTKGAKNEAHFAITLMNHMTEKDFVTKIVPFDKADDFIVITVEEDEDKPAEVAENMQRVD